MSASRATRRRARGGVLGGRRRRRRLRLLDPRRPRRARERRALGGGRASAAAALATTPPRPSEPFVPTPDLLRFCEPPEANGGRRLKVAVLLSGGVDSSVALTLLKAAGHDCVAFYLQIWFQEDFRNYWDQCPWEDDLQVARGVCDVLDVPLEMVPSPTSTGTSSSHSIGEISQGRTPNPDMLCNSRVKFGAFRDYLDDAHPGRFDRVAPDTTPRSIDRGRKTTAKVTVDA